MEINKFSIEIQLIEMLLSFISTFSVTSLEAEANWKKKNEIVESQTNECPMKRIIIDS